MRRQSLLPTLSEHPFFCMPESVGWYYDHPEHSVNRGAGAMNSLSLHLVTGGKGFVEIDSEPVVLQQGDAFLYFPLQEQRYYSSAEDPWNIRWMHFYGPTIKDFLIQKGFHRSPLWTVKQWKPLAQAYHQLLEEAERNKILHVTRLSILSYGVLAQFLNQAIPLTAHKGSSGYDRILRLMPSMQERACRPFVLEEWAAMAGVTPHYFCKLFRKATQMAPLDFITLCRLQTAKQLLLEDRTLTVKEIARRAGYPSASYFNKRFMSYEGMTPSEFRRLHDRKKE